MKSNYSDRPISLQQAWLAALLFLSTSYPINTLNDHKCTQYTYQLRQELYTLGLAGTKSLLRFSPIPTTLSLSLCLYIRNNFSCQDLIRARHTLGKTQHICLNATFTQFDSLALIFSHVLAYPWMSLFCNFICYRHGWQLSPPPSPSSSPLSLSPSSGSTVILLLMISFSSSML